MRSSHNHKTLPFFRLFVMEISSSQGAAQHHPGQHRRRQRREAAGAAVFADLDRRRAWQDATAHLVTVVECFPWRNNRKIGKMTTNVPENMAFQGSIVLIQKKKTWLRLWWGVKDGSKMALDAYVYSYCQSSFSVLRVLGNEYIHMTPCTIETGIAQNRRCEECASCPPVFCASLTLPLETWKEVLVTLNHGRWQKSMWNLHFLSHSSTTYLLHFNKVYSFPSFTEASDPTATPTSSS